MDKFLVGSFVLIKESGCIAIVVGDYAFLCDGNSDDFELTLAILDSNNDKIVNIVSWFELDKVKLIKTPASVLRNNLLKLYNYYHTR